MDRTVIVLALVATALSPAPVRASGHGPIFGGATPTLGQGGWQFDQAWMGRTSGEATEQTLRSMISVGITERLQISTSAPITLTNTGQPPMGRMTATMSDAPNLEVTGGWRFQTRMARRWRSIPNALQ